LVDCFPIDDDFVNRTKSPPHAVVHRSHASAFDAAGFLPFARQTGTVCIRARRFNLGRRSSPRRPVEAKDPSAFCRGCEVLEALVAQEQEREMAADKVSSMRGA
jgi:hypothetical protein